MATVLRGSDNFDSASGFKSVGTLKAWVNFNGTGTVAIRASGNVSSITDRGIGLYTINFIQAMPDANYALAQANMITAQASYICEDGTTIARTTTAINIVSVYGGGVVGDGINCSVQISR